MSMRHQLLEALDELWAKYPDLSFGQLIETCLFALGIDSSVDDTEALIRLLAQGAPRD